MFKHVKNISCKMHINDIIFENAYLCIIGFAYLCILLHIGCLIAYFIHVSLRHTLELFGDEKGSKAGHLKIPSQWPISFMNIQTAAGARS